MSSFVLQIQPSFLLVGHTHDSINQLLVSLQNCWSREIVYRPTTWITTKCRRTVWILWPKGMQ